MPVTLNDYLKQAQSPLAKGFVSDLVRASDLLRIVPFDTVNGLQVAGTRWQVLPSTAFRKLGAGYTESSGSIEQVEETLYQLGGDVRIDRILTVAQNVVEDPLRTQMRMKAQSMAVTFNHYFINGDHATDPDGFEGIKKRVSNMPSRMTLNMYNIDTGDGYPILKDAAHENTFIDYLHQAIKYVDGATHILCNEKTYLGLGQVLRRLGLLDTTTDAYGKVWNSFAGIPLVDVGLKGDRTTEVISSTEDPGDGGADCTSLYVVRLDLDGGLHGIQLAGTSPEPYDPLATGEMESGPQYLRRIDWSVGLFNLSQYCIARLKGFRVAVS